MTQFTVSGSHRLAEVRYEIRGRLARRALELEKMGYEISFTRYFYKPKPMRTLEEIRADILALEKESEGLLEEIRRRHL